MCQFLDSMARRSMEVPTDFLDTIREEKNEHKAPTPSLQIEKKYPFNRYYIGNILFQSRNLPGFF